MIRRVFLAPVFLLLAITLFSAPFAMAEMDVDGLEELLPIHATEAELEYWRINADQRPDRDRISDPPPLAPVRNLAEWEPATGVMVRYPLGVPYSLLYDFSQDVMLHVVVSSGYQSSAQSNLIANGISMDRVEFLVRNSDSIWTRDYGPWFVFDGDDEIAIIDHTYNRPRPNDNLIPIYFAQQQGIPVHSHDMYHTGGNYMTDGAHFSSSTRLVYNEAGMSQAAVDQLMLDYYGVENYMVLDYIESYGIHHIDTWGKFLDEENVLLKDVWSSHHTYDDLNQRATLLASLPSSTGRNYQVHRIYCYDIGGGSPASYTNSLILNQKIYVPFFGNGTHDNNALATYQAAAPGYEVEGYYYGGFISDDALHCRTKGVYDRGMLRVAHTPVLEEQSAAVPIEAFVHDHSNSGVTAVELHYRQNGGPWQTEAMVHQGDDLYLGSIPATMFSGDTDYYIHTEDNDGRTEGMPRTEPAAWYSFEHIAVVGVEQQAPRTARLNGNYPNPFNPSTTLSFELLFEDQVELVVYDTNGRLVRQLINDRCPAGETSVTWDGRDDQGRALASGVYLYRLRTAGIEYSRPATLLK